MRKRDAQEQCSEKESVDEAICVYMMYETKRDYGTRAKKGGVERFGMKDDREKVTENEELDVSTSLQGIGQLVRGWKREKSRFARWKGVNG